MERLTKRPSESEEAYLSCERCGKTGISECFSQENCTQTAVDRLAAIEDILGDDYELDRLRDLVEADREGRCVVLPKDGMVYYIEEAGGEKWLGNKPIQQIVLRCGFGMALLEFSLFDKGKYFSRAEAEAALKAREQE